MKAIFWVSMGIVLFTYLGYVSYLWLRKRFSEKPVSKHTGYEPTVSIVLVVHNEEELLPGKLHNLQSLAYSSSKLEIIVASDASTDRTESIIETAGMSDPRVRLVRCPVHRGKAAALREAIGAAHNEVILFTDARQMIEPVALREIAANFADVSIGCVSGELMLRNGAGGACTALSTYWRFEKTVRAFEASVGSTVGATGALYAVRRASVVLPPAGTLLDDVYIPVHVARQGLRVIFEPAARAWDGVTCQRNELRRKVRTLAGNYQLLKLAPWLLTEANPVRFGFICHKLCRLLVPFLLLAAFLANLALLDERFYVVCLLAQTCFYLAAIVGLFFPGRSVPRICGAASAFVLLNTAAFLAPFEYLRSRKEPNRLWQAHPLSSRPAEVTESSGA
jgi:cellulose synthase/poly-beta-1,6-N-acetylglucosamine synthase-like glycosyltransferase